MPSFLQLEGGLQDSTESESEVAHLCLTLCDPMDCSLPGSSIHEIFQARVLEWVAISFSRGSSQPRNRTQDSCIASRHFTTWATREATEPGIKWWAVLCWGPESLLRKRTKEMLELTFQPGYWKIEVSIKEQRFSLESSQRENVAHFIWTINKLTFKNACLTSNLDVVPGSGVNGQPAGLGGRVV